LKILYTLLCASKGIQHYCNHLFGDILFRKQRDDEKRQASKLSDITLLEVPWF